MNKNLCVDDIKVSLYESDGSGVEECMIDYDDKAAFVKFVHSAGIDVKDEDCLPYIVNSAYWYKIYPDVESFCEASGMEEDEYVRSKSAYEVLNWMFGEEGFEYLLEIVDGV